MVWTNGHISERVSSHRLDAIADQRVNIGVMDPTIINGHLKSVHGTPDLTQRPTCQYLIDMVPVLGFLVNYCFGIDRGHCNLLVTTGVSSKDSTLSTLKLLKLTGPALNLGGATVSCRDVRM